MIETTLRECACGAFFAATTDDASCAVCAERQQPAYMRGAATRPFVAQRLFYAPETLCGQQTLPGARS